MARCALLTPQTTFERRVLGAVPALVASDISRWREEFSRIDPTKVVSAMTDDGVEVACIGPGLTAAVVIQLAEAFDHQSPEICVIVVAEATPDLWREALRAGVRDVVAPSGDVTELAQAMARAFETASRRTRATHEASTPAPRSRIITVLSPKGGAGKTTVATNLAVGLATHRPGEVAIVDLDVSFGDVATALQLTPRTGLANVAACPDEVTTTMVKVFLTAHPSGLYALCAPDTPAEGDTVTHEHAAQALRLLAGEFRAVVVDTGAGLSEHALAAIELSTDLVLVSTPDVASVRSLRKAVDALDLLGMTGAKRRFVLNRSDARAGLALADIESVMDMKCDISIGGSASVPESMNLGSPVIESEPRSAVARQFQKLVDLFVDTSPGDTSESPPTPAAGFGLFRRNGR